MFMAAGQAMASKPIQLSLTPDIAVHDKSTHIAGLTLSIWGDNPQTSLALGFFNGFSGMSKGAALGIFLNYADDYKGVQLGSVNYVEGTMFGVQLGFVNYVESFKGVQLGLLNYADAVNEGLQIGLINLMPQNRWFSGFPDELAKGMILVNWRF
jgi:hypothetical protein